MQGENKYWELEVLKRAGDNFSVTEKNAIPVIPAMKELQEGKEERTVFLSPFSMQKILFYDGQTMKDLNKSEKEFD